jgi:hypothetical protein
MGEKEKMKVKVGDKVYDSLNEPIMIKIKKKFRVWLKWKCLINTVFIPIL